MCGLVSYWKLAAHERERLLVAHDLLVRREHDQLAVRDVLARLREERLPLRPLPLHVRGAADVGELIDVLPPFEAARDLPRGALAHPEDEEIGLRVEEDRATYLVAPVVVVRDAPERGLDAAEDDREARLVGERLATEVRVHDRRAVRTHVDLAVGGVLVLAAHLLLRGELVQHRVEVPGADPDEEARPPHPGDVVRRVPARLRDDPHAVAAPLEETRDEDRTERRVIDVRVPGDEEHVELVPATRGHLLARRREEF